MGTTLDTRNGRVTLVRRDERGGTETADFYEGIFRVTQGAGSRPVTALTLIEQLSCPRPGSADRSGQKEEAAAVG